MIGKVFDIKKFAVHDGPGIRTTLFLKGCPLNCIWCHNPEGIDINFKIWFFNKKCIQCGSCISVCEQKALSADPGKDPYIVIDQDKCIRCGSCVEVCPSKAITFDAYELSTEEAVEKLLQDRSFYRQSGGGITISGGDPLFQSDFSKSVLAECRKAGIHTAIETSMYAKPEILDSFTGLVDLFIVDIKLFDNDQHKKYTGVENGLILSNFKNLVSRRQNILVRIPLIPKITATEENLKAVGRFVSETSPETEIELINFNPLAENKYRLMGKDYKFLTSMNPFSAEELDGFYTILTKQGARVKKENS